MSAAQILTMSNANRIILKTISILCILASQALAQNDTCIVPVIFEPAILHNREPIDPSFADSAQFQKEVIDDHNWYRSQHSASLLKWNDDLAKSSNDWVNKCKWGHSGHPGVGENIALGYSKVVDAINGWALERTNYNFNKPGFGSGTGHFTQMVWKGTTEVGCARKQCQVPGFSNGNPTFYLVCQYQSPGNVVSAGQFEENVGRQISGDPKVGITGTLSSPPPKTSAPSTRSTAPVATSVARTGPTSTASASPVVVVTVTVTQDAATPNESSPAETATPAINSKPTTGPFWGNLKSSGAAENAFCRILKRRNGTERVEGSWILATVGVFIAIAFGSL
ncbi:hypothetical protein VTL71DRAFT_12725 [Oculimacula yallundae]|uniref:SCP domain-containing protein n=1 Tax=Oculimacula yallundae TaxID=86028 RepID=A0ABR4CNH0_9HELO